MTSFKKPPIPEEETPVLICRQAGNCNGWIREDFAFEKNANCPLCGSSMVRGMKVLPVIHNEQKELITETTWRRRRGFI